MVISTQNPSPQGHVVAFALPFWGHIKPLCALLAKIVRLRRVYATFFTDISYLPKVFDEISRQFDAEQEQDTRNLIRVVGLPSPPTPFHFDSFESAFTEGYKKLYGGEPIVATPNGNVLYEAIVRPQLAILDFLCYNSFKEIRLISGQTVPVYALQTSAMAAVLFIFGPENMGGNGDLAEKISKIDIKDPDLREKEISRIYRRINDQLVKIAGIPAMYDYEFVPQIPVLPVNHLKVVYLCQYVHRFFSECDGGISSSSRLYEGDMITKVQEWFGKRPVIAVGPLSPPTSTTEIIIEKVTSPVVRDVEQFLQDAVAKHGSHSVIHISFGTVCWPAEPDMIWTIIDVLIEHNIPFLFSHASPIAIIPEDVISKVKESRLGYMAPWLPQQMILQHEGCGWFITHCGQNSVMESLTAGVPLICWPYDVDQPLNAANIADVHHVGYELFEVRTGHGLRPIHRLGNKAPEGTIEAVRREAIDVFTKARGEDGERKRAKAQWFSKKFAEGWKTGGSSWEELGKIVSMLA